MPFDAKRLQAIRKKRKLTQRELADKLGIDYQRIQEYEGTAGKKKVKPGADRLEQLADALQTTMDYLTGRTEDSDPITAEDRRWLRDIHSNARRRAAFEEFRQKMLKQNPGKRGVSGE